MSDTARQAQDDLDFLRSIVDNEQSAMHTTGKVYGFAGLCYGIQCFANFADMLSGFAAPDIVRLAYNLLPTVVFILYNIVVVRREQAIGFGTGVIARAIGAGFGGAGIANAILAILFGMTAWRLGDWRVWLLFPVVVSALQGAIWFVVANVRKQHWTKYVAIGWFAAAIILSLLIEQVQWYLLALGIAMIVLMYLPGRIMKAGSHKD